MASSLQTLVKILGLEKQKEYQNKAVIGGFARFAYHWAREAHSQAQSDAHHAMVDEITELLREYETAERDRRKAIVDQITGMATSSEESRPASTQKSERSAPQSEASAPPDSKSEAPAPSPPVEKKKYTPAPRAPRPPAQKLPVRERRRCIPDAVITSPQETIEIYKSWGQPVINAKGVGKERAEQLARMKVETVGDLLHFFPRRYDDYSRMRKISELQKGEEVTIIGVTQSITSRQTRNGRPLVEAVFTDQSASIKLSWFNQPWITKSVHVGDGFAVSGKIDAYLGRLVINSPEMEPIERGNLHTNRVVPVYPLTEGLTARQMRRMMNNAIEDIAHDIPDFLPLWVREDNDLMDFDDAIYQAHFPDEWDDIEDAKTRLTFNELFKIHIAMLAKRTEWQSEPGQPMTVGEEWLDAFESSLPYKLTRAQATAADEVLTDIAKELPMNRLLQGDVGSGKTTIAALLISAAIENGAQGAIMAPTSILAEQHYAKLTPMMKSGPLGEGVNIALLIGAMSASEKDAVYSGLADGSINCVIGTHALIQDAVEFQNLGAVVIDEQHRFGVAQRGLLREKAANGNPHLLVMTATPIPRTLALTLHADLDLTIIDELPPGRSPVATRVLQPKERERAYAFIRDQVEKGHQAYIIYPLVEESDKVDAKAATAEYERLSSEVFPDLTIGLLHGRMSASEKEAVMAEFYAGEMQVLISTTVIEVGIDVPNATVMMVENANRFGLSQLHQLRGRVGRSPAESYCLLVADKAFIEVEENERLAIMEETTDGFKLAEHDWKLRGAGDLLGTRQSGLSQMGFIEMINPLLLEKVQKSARKLVLLDPKLEKPENKPLQYLIKTLEMLGDIS